MPTPLPENPSALLNLVRHGDPEEWGRLLERFRRYFTLLARVEIGRLLQSKTSPADVVQETFLRAHSFRHTFTGTTEAEFAAWLRSILATRLAEVARTYVGTDKRDVRLERQLELDLDHTSRALAHALAAPDDSPGHQASSRELEVLVADALEELPGNYREAVVLRHLQGLSTAQVALQMNCTEHSAQKYVRRGLAQLAVVLGKHA